MLTRRVISAFVLAGALNLGSCSFVPTRDSPLSVQRYVTSASPNVIVQSAIGESVSQEDAFRAMVELTRGVAVALQDDSLRRRVFEAIHSSPYREHKLHFRTFTATGMGLQLLSAAAAATGRSLESMKAVRDSAIDLEFYMPVRSHFATWMGDADLLVATSFHADDDIPVAFRAGGERVILTSAEDPPSTPTLVLVRTETNFDAPRSANLWAPGVAAGVYMTFSYLSDLGEGWPNGAPELEIQTSWRVSGDSLAFNQCSGEDAGNPNRAGPGIKSAAYEYNQDNNTWSGRVRIIDSAQAVAAQSVDSVIIYWVIEDDDQKCLIKTNAVADARNFFQSVFGSAPYAPPYNPRGWRNRFTFNPPDPIEVELIRAGLIIVNALIAGDDDDIVGIMVKPGNIGLSYSDANMAVVKRESGQLTVVGRAMLSRYDTPPPATLTSTLTGPSSVRSGATCLWTVTPTNGTAPYTYSWNQSPNGSSIPGELVYTNSGTAFTVTVYITDAAGAWGEKSKSVSISPSAPACTF